MVWPPAPLQTAIVRGHWENPVDGSDLVGTATLTPVNAAVSPDASLLFTQGPRKVALVAGVATWSQVLLSDSPGLGAKVLYELRVDGVDWSDPPRLVELSSALVSGGVIDLKGVATAVPGPQVASYLLAATRGAPDGVASLGPDGLVPTSQLPASGGGVPASRQIATQNGLTGGGDLSANRTLAPVYGTTANTICQGNDSRLSDNRNPTAHTHPQSDITALVTALAALDSRLLLLESRIPAFDLGMENLVAISGDPALFRTGATVGSGWAVRLRVPAGKPITGVGMNVNFAGVVGAGGTNGYGLMDDSGTFIAATPDDNNLWTVIGKRPKSFTTQIPAQSADWFVYAGPRNNGYTTAPGFDFIDGASSGVGGRLNGLNQTHRRSIPLSGSAWGNISPTGGPDNGGFMPLIWLF